MLSGLHAVTQVHATWDSMRLACSGRWVHPCMRRATGEAGALCVVYVSFLIVSKDIKPRELKYAQSYSIKWVTFFFSNIRPHICFLYLLPSWLSCSGSGLDSFPP
jgi:hypothetical protein